MSTVAAPLLVSPSGAPLLSVSDHEWEIVAPFPERAWPRVWIWMEDFRASVMDDFAPQNMEAFVEQRMQAAGFEFTYGVAKGDELGGLITVQPLSPHLASAHFLFKKSFWGSDTTLPAIRTVLGGVFEMGFEKITSIAFAENFQLLALVRKLGGTKEGHLRRNTMRKGKASDQMVLGLLREDFEAARSAPVKQEEGE